MWRSFAKTLTLFTCLLYLGSSGNAVQQRPSRQDVQRSRERTIAERKQNIIDKVRTIFNSYFYYNLYLDNDYYITKVKTEKGINREAECWFEYYQGITGFDGEWFDGLPESQRPRDQKGAHIAVFKIRAKQLKTVTFGEESYHERGSFMPITRTNYRQRIVSPWQRGDVLLMTIMVHQSASGVWNIESDEETIFSGSRSGGKVKHIRPDGREMISDMPNEGIEYLRQNPGQVRDLALPKAPVINDPDGARIITDNFIECADLGGNWFTVVNSDALLEIGNVDWRKDGNTLLILGDSYRLHGTHRNIVVAKEPILSIDVEVATGNKFIPKTIRWYGANSAAISLRKPSSCAEVPKYRVQVGQIGKLQESNSPPPQSFEQEVNSVFRDYFAKVAQCGSAFYLLGESRDAGDRTTTVYKVAGSKERSWRAVSLYPESSSAIVRITGTAVTQNVIDSVYNFVVSYEYPELYVSLRKEGSLWGVFIHGNAGLKSRVVNRLYKWVGSNNSFPSCEEISGIIQDAYSKRNSRRSLLPYDSRAAIK